MSSFPLQLYVSFPASRVQRPAKSLKGFKRVFIPTGRSITVPISVKADDLAYWDEKQHTFVLEKGSLQLMVGAASDDIRLRGSIEIR